MFEYSLGSDLHMDTGHTGKRLSEMDWKQNIIIAGDLGNGLGNFKFINKLKNKGHVVFCVDGNHEHYANANRGRTLLETETQFYSLLDEQPQVRMLRDDLYLIGCNGWYEVEDERHWKNYLNDSRHGALSAKTVNDAAWRHADFVGNALAKVPDGAKAIVVTHTAPCEESLDPRFVGSDGNVYYWNPLMERVLLANRKAIAVWHHGHTHAAVDLVYEGVHIVTNPRGYPGENPSWHPITLKA